MNIKIDLHPATVETRIEAERKFGVHLFALAQAIENAMDEMYLERSDMYAWALEHEDLVNKHIVLNRMRGTSDTGSKFRKFMTDFKFDKK